MPAWAEMSEPDLRRRLADRPTEVGLLPIGATEQHGPHLPTGTDTIVATAFAEAVSARTGAPVLPAVAVGCSFGHGRRLAGTLSISPEELAGVIRGIVTWAADSGLRRVLALNAHFGNAAAIAVAADHLRLGHPELRFGHIDWWAADPKVAAEVSADGQDVHANRAETSVMLVLAPDLVRIDRLATADDADRTEGLVFRYTAECLSENGVTGRPSEASAGLGRRLVERTVAALSDRVERGRREEPPLVAHRAPEGSGEQQVTATGGRPC